MFDYAVRVINFNRIEFDIIIFDEKWAKYELFMFGQIDVKVISTFVVVWIVSIKIALRWITIQISFNMCIFIKPKIMH